MLIPSRFNGPPGSGHGGYTCGTVAALLGAGPARVSLRAPVPLDHDLQVVRSREALELRDGDRLIAEAERAELELDPTEAVAPARAAEASRRGYGRWATQHPFPHCFGCGPARRPGNGLRLFPGPLGDGRFAAAWTPDLALAGDESGVARVYVWAALDCPTSAPVAESGRPVAVLAQLHARIVGSVEAGKPHAIVSWRLGLSGRKRHAACAMFDREGRPVAMSRALWIEPRA